MNRDITFIYDESLVTSVEYTDGSGFNTLPNAASPLTINMSSLNRNEIRFNLVAGVTIDQFTSMWRPVNNASSPWSETIIGRSVVTNGYVRPSSSTDEVTFVWYTFFAANTLKIPPLTPAPTEPPNSIIWLWDNEDPITMRLPKDYGVNPDPDPDPVDPDPDPDPVDPDPVDPDPVDPDPEPEDPEQTHKILCNVNMSHVATMTWLGQPAVGGEILEFVVGTTATLEIVFKEGVVVQSSPVVQYYNRETGKVDEISSLVGSTYTVVWGGGDYHIIDRALNFQTYMDLVDVSTPFNKSFLMDREAMVGLTQVMQRWNSNTWEGSSDYANESDASFILNLLLMPFKLPEEVIGDELEILIGATDTDIVCPVITEDQIVIDLGNIEVPSVGSVLDYEGVGFDLHLPFIADVISVEPVEVVGKVLNIRYLIDIYTGAVSVNLYNGLDYPFFSMSTKIGRSIPFKFFEGVQGSMENIYPVDNRLYSAYLRESRSEVVEGQFNNLVTQTGTLEQVSGYVEVDHCELVDVDESNMVVDILKGGVIIRG